MSATLLYFPSPAAGPRPLSPADSLFHGYLSRDDRIQDWPDRGRLAWRSRGRKRPILPECKRDRFTFEFELQRAGSVVTTLRLWNKWQETETSIRFVRHRQKRTHAPDFRCPGCGEWSHILYVNESSVACRACDPWHDTHNYQEIGVRLFAMHERGTRTLHGPYVLPARREEVCR